MPLSSYSESKFLSGVLLWTRCRQKCRRGQDAIPSRRVHSLHPPETWRDVSPTPVPPLCLVAMSDELPPPPVSKTRASQIAINFAGRVKHQMKDERKQVLASAPHAASLTTRPAGTHTCSPALPGARQWTELEKELASEAVRKVEKLMRRCSCCSYRLLPHPLTTPAQGVCYLTTRFYSPRAVTGRSSLAIRTLSCAARTRSSPRTRRKATRTASCAGECLDVL